MLHFYECPKMHLWIVVGDYNPTWATSKLCNFSSQGFTLSKFSNFGDESEGSYGWVRYLRIANLTNSKLVDFRHIVSEMVPTRAPHHTRSSQTRTSIFNFPRCSWVMSHDLKPADTLVEACAMPKNAATPLALLAILLPLKIDSSNGTQNDPIKDFG